MNIRFVYFSSLPTIGGLELNIHHTARSLVLRGHSVEVLTTTSQNLSKTQIKKHEEIDGVDYRRFSYLAVPGNKFAFLSPGMLRYLWKVQSEVVHVFSYLPSFFTNGAYLVSKLRRTPLVATPMFNPDRHLQYEGRFHRVSGNAYDRWVGPKLLKLPDAVIPSTPGELRWLEAKRLKVTEMVPTWAYGQVEDGKRDQSLEGQAEREAKFRRRWGLMDAPIVMSVGRVESRKGFDLLVRAFSEVKQTVPAAELVIVGEDWGQTPAIRSLAEELGVADSVTMTGKIGDDELTDAYGAASCLVMCSRYEGLGVTPLEAWRNGTAVVVFDRFPGPVTEETGLLAKYLDVEDLARKTVRMLTDHTLRERLEAAGRAEAESEYDWGLIIERLESVYESVVSRDMPSAR